MNGDGFEFSVVSTPRRRNEYLNGLIACFPAWGDTRRAAWCFERRMTGLEPDLLCLMKASLMVAGSALVYRRVDDGHGRVTTVGIVSGAWTLEAFRNRGSLGRLLDESRRLVVARGGDCVVAFVRAHNPSRRVCERKGAIMVPTFYCVSTDAVPDVTTGHVRVLVTPKAQERSVETDCARFVYTDEEWQSQFIARPDPVVTVGVPDRWWAAIEHAADLDCLLTIGGPDAGSPDVITALTARARNAARRLFVFTTGVIRAKQLESLGFDVQSGFFPVMPVDVRAGRAWPQRQWDLDHGDRM